MAHLVLQEDRVRRSIDFWVPTVLLVVGLLLVAGALFAQDTPKPDPLSPTPESPSTSAEDPPTVGSVELTGKEAEQQRIVLYSYELSRDYHQATYNFYFRNQGDADLTLNDWDVCLTGWKAPYTLDVELVTDDKSWIRDLGPIDMLSHRPSGREWKKRETDGVEATVHPGHVYLIHTLDADADYYSILKVVKIEAGGRAEIIGRKIRVKSKPTAGTVRRTR